MRLNAAIRELGQGRPSEQDLVVGVGGHAQGALDVLQPDHALTVSSARE